MRKNLTYKVLAAVLTLSAANWAVPANVLAGEIDTDGKYIVTDDGETISYSYNGVYGNGHSFTINGGTIMFSALAKMITAVMSAAAT